jgi:hypothetical protein
LKVGGTCDLLSLSSDPNGTCLRWKRPFPPVFARNKVTRQSRSGSHLAPLPDSGDCFAVLAMTGIFGLGKCHSPPTPVHAISLTSIAATLCSI